MKNIVFISFLCMSTACSGHLTSEKVARKAKPMISSQEQSEWNLLIGKWHGRQKMTDGGIYEWLADKGADGKYQIHFKLIDKSGKLTDRVEVGEWGASGGIYFTIFKGWLVRGKFIPNDDTSAYNRDTYKIISLDDKKFTYESLSNHEVFSVEKVTESFELK